MLRDKSLIPLSHQHQHALALCVRIDRAAPIGDADLTAWRREAAELFRGEIAVHFAAEEEVLFPAARRFKELRLLVEELLADHVWLRQSFAQAETGRMPAAELSDLAKRLSGHIRKEERQLFERLQKLLSREEMAALGEALADALKDANQTCILPNEATRLRPR